jgi:tellurite resistance protein TerC
MVSKFSYLQLGLSAILVFIGIKMLGHASHLFEIPIWASLGFIVLTLAVAIVASLRKEAKAPADEPEYHAGEGLQELTDDDG